MQARPAPNPEDSADRILRGEELALARLLSALEDGEPWAGEALRLLRRAAVTRNSHKPHEAGPDAVAGDTRNSRKPSAAGPSAGSPRVSQVIGITGPPGSGKSTLADKLIHHYRARGERVAVLAVDPSSPYTGGAILGDRIRMQTLLPGGQGVDEGLFIRSLATRGRLGGLSRATAQSTRALEAAGYGVILVETVGIGQSEVDVVQVADTVVLVSMPGSGDDIQAIKAGVMEIGDIFVVNKADREGADRAVREIRSMLEIAAALAAGRGHAAPIIRGGPDTLIGHHAFSPLARAPDAAEPSELPPVLKTVAETGEGLDELAGALDARWAKLIASGGLESRRMRGAMAEARSLLSDRVLSGLEELEGGLEERLAAEIVAGEREAAEAAGILFDAIRKGGLE